MGRGASPRACQRTGCRPAGRGRHGQAQPYRFCAVHRVAPRGRGRALRDTFFEGVCRCASLAGTQSPAQAVARSSPGSMLQLGRAEAWREERLSSAAFENPRLLKGFAPSDESQPCLPVDVVRPGSSPACARRQHHMTTVSPAVICLPPRGDHHPAPRISQVEKPASAGLFFPDGKLLARSDASGMRGEPAPQFARIPCARWSDPAMIHARAKLRPRSVDTRSICDIHRTLKDDLAGQKPWACALHIT